MSPLPDPSGWILLLSIPARITTPPLTIEGALEDRGTVGELMDRLMEKVRAEDERMRRILPAAPARMHWEMELQSQEPEYNFERNTGDVMVRLVYRLREG